MPYRNLCVALTVLIGLSAGFSGSAQAAIAQNLTANSPSCSGDECIVDGIVGFTPYTLSGAGDTQAVLNVRIASPNHIELFDTTDTPTQNTEVVRLGGSFSHTTGTAIMLTIQLTDENDALIPGFTAVGPQVQLPPSGGSTAGLASSTFDFPLQQRDLSRCQTHY